MMKLSRKNGWSNLARTAAVLAMCFAGATGLTSCGKKAPPPKPAPPPPPAPAPEVVEVSFDTISQDMKADARVQFAPDLKLEDEDVARAIVTLADAWAKGDTATLSRIMSKSTRNALEGVEELGGFAADNQAETVRVVFVAKNDEAHGLKVSFSDVVNSFAGEGADAQNSHNKIPPEAWDKITSLAATAFSDDPSFDGSLFRGPMSAEKMAKFGEAIEKIKSDNPAIFQQIEAALSDATSVPGLKSAEYLALIAVQTPKGVELTGWGLEKAFGKWTFTNASTDGQLKKSASEWDGVGVAGFSRDSATGMKIAAAPKEADGDASESDNEGAEETKDDSEQQKGPDEKRTPHGPVKIPGGG